MTSWISESRILAPVWLPFAASIGLHIIAWRIWPRASLRRVLFGPLALGGLSCALWLWIRPVGEHDASRIADAVAALAIYSGLVYVYADLYGFHRTAIRLRALRVIHRNGGSATRDQLVQVCGHEAMVDQRLAQYCRSGDLVRIDGRYRMGRRRILYLARGFRLVRRLLLGKHSCHI